MSIFSPRKFTRTGFRGGLNWYGRTRHAAFATLFGIGARIAPAPYHVLIRKAA
jgi:hypothetical protein